MKKFEITEEQIKQAYDAACEDWKQRIKEWFPELYKIESGWYYNNGKNVLSYYDFENINQYGFNNYGKWYQFDNVTLSGSEYPAPENEVFERLKEEAIRRGYKEGVVVDNSNLSIINFPQDGRPLYSSDMNYYNNLLQIGQKFIFHNGKWAEIISTPRTTKRVHNNR